MNAAFLDKLEGRGKEKTKESVEDDEGNYVAAEDFGQQTGHPSHLNPDPEQSSGWTGEAGELRWNVWINLSLPFLKPFFFSQAQCWLTKYKSDMWHEVAASSFLTGLWLSV